MKEMFQRKEFERAAPESVGIDSKDVEWLLDRLEYDGFTEPHGLMLMRYGKVFAEGWWSPYHPGIRHGQQSHSKTYAATAVGIAVTEGLVQLDERVIDIFPEEAPENPSENLRKLKVRHVLCMGCGMEEMPAPSKEWIKDFLHTPVLHEPGTAYMYNSAGSSMLGAIVRKKTGMGLHEYLKPRLYDKIGIFAENHVWMCMPDGLEAGGGGLFAATEDNLRLMKLYADGGVWEGERILSEDYVRLATTLQNESATEARNNPVATDNFAGYGYQIWMCRPKGVYRADGAMGQFTIVVPDMELLIAITENAAGAHWAQATLDTLWEFLERIRKNPAVQAQPEAAQHLKKRMEALALPAAPYAPYSPLAAEIKGKAYQVTEGELRLAETDMGHIMAGLPLGAPVSEFSFDFTCDSCILSWMSKAGNGQVTAAMDGSRRWNDLKEGIVSQTLFSAAWIQENRLELRARRIETCVEERYLFTFDENTVTVTAEAAGVFNRQKAPVRAAVRRAGKEMEKEQKNG